MAKNKASDGTRYLNTLSDNTSFMWNVQLERANAGYCWDGRDSGGLNIPIQITGTPIYMSRYTGKNMAGTESLSVESGNNTYYVPDVDTPDVHPPPPQIWACNDCYFVAVPGGLQFYNGAPEGSQAESGQAYMSSIARI